MGSAVKGTVGVLYLLFLTVSCTRYSRRAGSNCRNIDKHECVKRDPVECGGQQCLAPSVCRVKKKDCSGGNDGNGGGCAPVCGQVGTPCGDPNNGLLCKFDEACVDSNGCNPLGLDPSCIPSNTCQKKDDWDIDPAFVDVKCSSFHVITSNDTCGSLLETWGMHTARFFRLNQGFDCNNVTPGGQVCSAGRVLYKEPQCGGFDSHCEAGFECVANADCEFNTVDAKQSECTEETYEVCEPPPDGDKELCGDRLCDDGYVCKKRSARVCGRHHENFRKIIHSRLKTLRVAPSRSITKYIRFG
ncbi:hypothetical protein BSKO_13861 [Bryopsis sp. KO-2023]|nr:hypothetical protein BSKO_13861 [Bryopsis sp. KO-2023]